MGMKVTCSYSCMWKGQRSEVDKVGISKFEEPSSTYMDTIFKKKT
jgi:hypothetical protein